MVFEGRLEGGEGSSQQMFGARTSQTVSTTARAQAGAAQACVSKSKEVSVAGTGSQETSRRCAQRGEGVSKLWLLADPNYITAACRP